MPKKRYNNKQQICASLLKLELLVKMIDPIYFKKNLPGGKRARPLVPPRLALLAIRRKLISGGSHNWGGGASETPNFRS